MSTLTVTNIKKTGETASRDVSGVAAAWVNFNGTGTVAIRDSVNVASITDNATADFAVNFSNSMANTSYSFQLCCDSNATSLGAFYGGVQWDNDIKSTSAIEAHFMYINPYSIGNFDPTETNFLIHGDLA